MASPELPLPEFSRALQPGRKGSGQTEILQQNPQFNEYHFESPQCIPDPPGIFTSCIQEGNERWSGIGYPLASVGGLPSQRATSGKEHDWENASTGQGESHLSNIDNQPWGEPLRESLGQSSERERRERAHALGLSEQATWGEIFAALNEQERQVVAKALELPLDASWRAILAATLGLHGTASPEEMIERIRAIQTGSQSD